MRLFKNILIVVVIMVVGWNSVYFAKLDEMKASKALKEFDAGKYANEFWNNTLIPNLDKAVDIQELVSLMKTDEKKAFDNYSNALGIGNLKYFLVRGTAKISYIDNDYITLDNNTTIATEFIFGNAVRDASGLIDINDFVNTMDFNNVSAEINKIIRAKVLPSFKGNVKSGDTIEFTGAIELNKQHVQLNNIEIIPIQLKIVK
ncbi:MAG: DUF2291 domain-containing protein [Bacteroidota bacterium]